MMYTASQQRDYRKKKPDEKLAYDREKDRIRKRIKRKNMKTPERRAESQKAIARRRNQVSTTFPFIYEDFSFICPPKIALICNIIEIWPESDGRSKRKTSRRFP